MSTGLFACLRSVHDAVRPVAIAREFSPRIQRYGAACVVFDVSGLGRLLGDAEAIGGELLRASADVDSDPDRVSMLASTTIGPLAPAPRSSSRSGIRIHAHPREHAAMCFDRFQARDANLQQGVGITSGAWGPAPARSALGGPVSPGSTPSPRASLGVSVAPTQTAALLMAAASPGLTVASDAAAALAPIPLQVLHRLAAEHYGVTFLRGKASAPATSARGPWPPWDACAHTFDMLQRWGLTTLGELAALPAGELSARTGQDGLALQQIAQGIDRRPLVPDPDVPRFIERMELEWPIDALEPLSFVLARLLDPLSAALERADRGAAAIRLDLRLVDRAVHARVLQLPAAMRDARVLRTLLLLDLESHPPPAAIDVVTIEIDPAPGRVIQYSLLERATPSAEAIATLTARLGALVGESRCGTPALLESHRPDAFEMRRFAPDDRGAAGSARRPSGASCLRRFRPPVAVRVAIERGRPARVLIDRRGMPGGEVTQAAGPWRASGAWWDRASVSWDRDEWDVSLSDGSICRLYRERGSACWFLEGVVD